MAGLQNVSDCGQPSPTAGTKRVVNLLEKAQKKSFKDLNTTDSVSGQGA